MFNTRKRDVVLELAKLGMFGLGIYALTPYSVNPNQRKTITAYDSYHYVYWTFITLYLTIAAYSICLIARKYKRISRVATHLLTMSAVLNGITTATFWTLYFIDKEFIVGKAARGAGNETYLITELSLHLFPVLLTWLEQIAHRIVYNKNYIYALVGITLAYASLVHSFKSFVVEGKVYVYPFLNIASNFHILCFWCGVFLLGVLFYSILLRLNKNIHQVRQPSVYNIEANKNLG
ncbi:hypothetical protein ENBRE01_0754 [Enteropsectra breve]|nr:hypothetical protein ENBRE01_0754 [Enteropsectra breve]